MWVLSLLQACLEEEDCVIIHVYLQDIIQMKRVGKIQGWSRLSQEWIKLINSQSVEDVPRGIKWSHGMVSIVHCTLCTNPWSMWEFYVGLGTCPWACVKRQISYNHGKDDIKWWSSSRLSCARSSGASRRDQVLESCHPFGFNGLVKMCRRVAHP